MHDPYLYLSNADEYHYTARWGERGVEFVAQQGTHALFAYRVPFIPSLMSSDFTRPQANGVSRTQLVTQRLISFVGDLASIHAPGGGDVAFALRLISCPQASSAFHKAIDVVFMGKVFHQNRARAQEYGRALRRTFESIFPCEDPFNYLLEPIAEQALADMVTPIPITDTERLQLKEVRKFADVEPLSVEAGRAPGFFPHRFAPKFDGTAQSRLLETLARQPQRCVVNICIRPTQLLPEELQAINHHLAAYQRITESLDRQNWLYHYRKERFDDLRRSYVPLINARRRLLQISLQVLGEQEAPEDLLDALGAELFDNALTDEPRLWARAVPEHQRDRVIAWYNALLLEQRPWGEQPTEPALARLCMLATAKEAAGAFRLPIPPESGYLPGLLVREEPFVLPRAQPQKAERTLELGEILHRGWPTGQQFHVAVADLVRHGLVAGATGAGKTTTCQGLLAQLWVRYRIPFLILYPIDKLDYRVFMADPRIREDLLIFTVGDESTAPFRLNPFVVADGVPLRTHLSLLMRCISAAFTMWDPLPAIYRAALRQMYSACGWDVDRDVGGAAGRRVPTMATFYETIVRVSEEMSKNYGAEIRGNIRQACEIRIRDLLTNLGSVLNTDEPAPLAHILQRPTVMELGRVGSTEDTALLMGFMLMLIAEQVQSNARRLTLEQRQHQIHICLVEEAHKLMSAGHTSGEYTVDPRVKGGEDFSNLLAEVRGYGEGILIAEQIPTNLVPGAIGNTYLKVMHWLEDERSFDLFCRLMNLDERQQRAARTLDRGCAIVRDRFGQPVHVRVARYPDGSDRPVADDSDQAVRTFMQGRVRVPEPLTWSPDPLARYYDIPQRSAIFALPQAALTERLKQIGEAADQGDWEAVKAICVAQLRTYDLPPDPLLARCYLARAASLPQTSGSQAGRTIYEAFPSCRAALEQFPL